MHDPDLNQPQPRSLATAALSRLLADEGRVSALADDLADWLAVQGFPAEHRTAHLAAKIAEVGLAAIDAGSTSRLPAEWLARFREAPIAARTAVVLHVLAEADTETTARWCFRPASQVADLVARVGSLDRPPEPASPRAPVAIGATSPTPGQATAPAPTVPHPPAPTLPTAPAPPLPDPDATPAPPEAPPSPPISLFPALPSADPDASAGPHLVPPPVAPVVASGPTNRRRSRLRRAVRVVIVAAVVAGAVVTAVILSKPPERPAFRTSPPATVGPSTEITKTPLSTGCDGMEADAVLSGETAAVDVAGLARTYRVSATAPSSPGTPRGLLVAIPDLNEPVELLLAESGVEPLGAELGLVVATLVPSVSPAQWNVLGASDGPNDIVYASSVVDALEARLCIDQARVALVGKGVGGHFAAALACAEPDRYHLVAMVAGAYQPASCGSLTDTTVALVIGGADDIFPPAGGLGPAFSSLADPNALGAGARYDPPSFEAAISAWAQTLDCDPAQGRAVFDGPPPAAPLTGNRLTECRDSTSLITVAVTSAGHEWTPAASQIIREQLLARRDR